MNFLRTGLRFAARGLPRRTPFIRQPLRPQQRFASYQRFPGKGGSGPSSNPYSNFTPFARVQYIWRNYQTPVLIVGAGGTTFYVLNLEEVPITHRRRFNIISPETEKSLVSDREYQSLLQQFRGKILPREHPYTQTIARIVERLLPSAHGLDGGDWKVHVIDDPNMVNAFVMPGGKVFVFTGIFPVAQDENGLAAVLGHEIGHNVAHHVGERLSRQFFTIAAAFLISSIFDISGQFGNSITDLILTLPNGRVQETEADHIGLLMMAESCYDPRKAPELWMRMNENEKKRGGAPPQFLSTHPSSSSRGETMQRWMPEAMQKYDESDCSGTGRLVDEFRRLTDIGKSMRRSAPIPVLVGGSNSSDGDEDYFF